MAKRKSLTTDVDEEAVKPLSKPSKKPKVEEVERDELDGSEDETPLTAKKPAKYKTEDSDEAIDVQSTPDGEKYIDLGKNKRATVRSFKGTTLIDIREFYADKESGELKPGKKGISLGVDQQWETLQRVGKTVDQLIAELKK
ncbi:transcriptional Coactivator p15-domain-containing protein [Mycena epipterygia]|nr:transcriptional Coactivator p15-domain-containing protein [Mycena epipterygia]